VQTLQLVAEFVNHFDVIFSADISPDKTLAASFGADQRVRLWDARTGKEIAQWHLSDPTLVYNHHPLRFSQDGRYLLMAGVAQMVVRMDDLSAMAKSRLTRALTPEEKTLFLDDRLTTDLQPIPNHDYTSGAQTR
jgi:WD40 repeat protein